MLSQLRKMKRAALAVAPAIAPVEEPENVVISATTPVEEPENRVVSAATKQEIETCISTIASASIVLDPVPHMVVDNVFTEAFLEEIHAMWPKGDLFTEAYAGRFNMSINRASLDKMTAEQSAFFETLGADIYPKVIEAALGKFSGILYAAFGDFTQDLEWGVTPFISQSNIGFDGHETHTHFYHNPNWAMSSLLYLGPDAEGHEGTSLWKLIDQERDPEWLANVAMDALRWDFRRDIEPAKEIDYKMNRLFCFLDGPFALHGVMPGKTIENHTRRILRSHVAVNSEKYFKERMDFLETPDSLHCIRMFQPPITVRGDVMEDVTAKDLHLKEGPGKAFTLSEIARHEKAKEPSQIIEKPEKIGALPKFI